MKGLEGNDLRMAVKYFL
jgi:ATP-binding cassette, subfamily A (ABC1), member 3